MNQIFDALKMIGKDKPCPWSDIRVSIIAGRATGINEVGFTNSFIISDTFLKVFDEMIPPRSLIDEWKHTAKIHLGKMPIGDETGRAISINFPDKLNIQGRNNGDSKEILTGVRLKRRVIPGEIGALHTHPIDKKPSAKDLTSLITGAHVFEGVITPRHVYLLFRTQKTPNLPSDLVADGYIMAMGKSKGKLVLNEDEPWIKEFFPGFAAEMKESQNWQPDVNDFDELHIMAFEAQRGSALFQRLHAKSS